LLCIQTFFDVLLFSGCSAATQLACQLHQDRTQEVYGNHNEAWKRLTESTSSPDGLVSLFVCLFVVIKLENLQSTSCLGLEVIPLGVYPLGLRSSSCGPTLGTPLPRTTLRAN